MASGSPHDQQRDLTHGAFLTTRWSRVLRAGDLTEPDAEKALAELCRDYWRPLYHFARRRGNSPEDSQDLTQGFIMHLLESGGFGRADHQKGRFRTFLISAFCHFMANQTRYRMAQKRGGHVLSFSMDDPDIEAAYSSQVQDHLTPELHYERTWALALLERVMQRLREQYAKAERVRLYQALQPHLSGGQGRPSYAALAAELGMSEGAVTVALHRMRKLYGKLVRDEIASTVATEAEVDEELQHLIAILATPSA